MADAFYIPEDGDLFASTEHTIGPWGPDAQHAGPPAALLGHAIELTPSSTDKLVSRITFDILKPVPIERLRVNTEIVRPGKLVDLVHASLSSETTEVMRASAWRIRRAEMPDAHVDTPVQRPPGPDEAAPTELFSTGHSKDYLHSMDVRFAAGSFLETGPATAWFRMRYPLIEGVAVSPLTRVLIAADSASGISSALDFMRWVFINPDLDVHLLRLPVSEWVCLDATTTVGPNGIAAARSAIFDTNGLIGSGAQSLLIAPRGG